jgi:hypothetical protein
LTPSCEGSAFDVAFGVAAGKAVDVIPNEIEEFAIESMAFSLSV